MEQKCAGLLQLLVAGGRLFGYKAGSVLGAETPWHFGVKSMSQGISVQGKDILEEGPVNSF